MMAIGEFISITECGYEHIRNSFKELNFEEIEILKKYFNV